MPPIKIIFYIIHTLTRGNQLKQKNQKCYTTFTSGQIKVPNKHLIFLLYKGSSHPHFLYNVFYVSLCLSLSDSGALPNGDCTSFEFCLYVAPAFLYDFGISHASSLLQQESKMHSLWTMEHYHSN